MSKFVSDTRHHITIHAPEGDYYFHNALVERLSDESIGIDCSYLKKPNGASDNNGYKVINAPKRTIDPIIEAVIKGINVDGLVKETV